MKQPEAASPQAPAAPGTDRFADPSIAPGTLLGATYRVERRLGGGGMGDVYLAFHVGLGTLHAVKGIRPTMAANRQVTDLFYREAKILRGVRHDAVVSYDGFFRDADGRDYLVMEYVDGPSLSERLRQGALAVDEVLALRDRLAAGLAEAHRRGAVHRDISPDNVILPGNLIAAAKLIDFGLSKINDANQETIIGPSFAGKFRYASPEQLDDPGMVDQRSDIYSLGLTLAGAARGEPLDMGSTFDSALRARRQVPDLSDLPASLRPWLTAMLQPDPAARPANLETLLANWPGTTATLNTAREPRPGTPDFSDSAIDGRTTPPTGPRLGWIAVAITVTLLLVALAAYWIATFLATESAPEPAPHEELPTHNPLQRLSDGPSPRDDSGAPRPDPTAGIGIGGTAAAKPLPAPAMVKISEGCFAMGTTNDPDRYEDETPHQVCLQRFALSAYEIRVAEFKRFVDASGYRTLAERPATENRGCYTFERLGNQKTWGYQADKSWRDPGFLTNDENPVVCVALEDADAYVKWLSNVTGRQFRLPTESQWEYAARAGTTTRFYWGDSFAPGHAQYRDSAGPSRQDTQPGPGDEAAVAVKPGQYPPNAWQLYDLLGNVSEWTCSPYAYDYDGSEQSCVPAGSVERSFSIRGGSWFDTPKWLRVSARDRVPPTTRKSTLGFRIVEDLGRTPDAK